MLKEKDSKSKGLEVSNFISVGACGWLLEIDISERKKLQRFLENSGSGLTLFLYCYWTYLFFNVAMGDFVQTSNKYWVTVLSNYWI